MRESIEKDTEGLYVEMEGGKQKKGEGKHKSGKTCDKTTKCVVDRYFSSCANKRFYQF